MDRDEAFLVAIVAVVLLLILSDTCRRGGIGDLTVRLSGRTIEVLVLGTEELTITPRSSNVVNIGMVR